MSDGAIFGVQRTSSVLGSNTVDKVIGKIDRIFDLESNISELGVSFYFRSDLFHHFECKSLVSFLVRVIPSDHSVVIFTSRFNIQEVPFA